MQIDNISQYLQNIVHGANETANALSNSQAAKKTAESDSAFVSFQEYYNAAINDSSDKTSNTATTMEATDLYDLYTRYSSQAASVLGSSSSSKYTYSTEDSTSLEVAQDAYADLLEMEANAVSGSSSSSDDDEDTIDQLTDAATSTSASESETSISSDIYSAIKSLTNE